MKLVNSQKLFYILLGLWFIIDLIQISTTGIIEDEAYYYVWSHYLDWGYFDHPPLVAVLIFLSDILFEGLWSVRFLSAVLHVFTIVFIWKTIDSKYKQTSTQVLYFFGLAFSLPMFSVYGFITTPDSVLLFFFAGFTWALKHVLSRRRTSDIVWLAIAIAGMVYSKYHAFLVLFLALVMHWKLMKQKRFWLLFLIVLILVLPHFIWLYNNEFVTFKYHLIERSEGFNLNYVLEFIPAQLGVLNPLFLSLFIISFFKKRQEDLFIKTMRLLGIGILIFFALMTLKGRVEAHWTTIASIPIIYVIFPYILDLSKSYRSIKYILLGFVGIILTTRVLISLDKLPSQSFNKNEIAYYQNMKEFVGDKPIIFRGSFQEPSIYYFINKTDRLGHKPYYKKRHTQFELWAWEEKFLGQKVFISAPFSKQAPQHKFKTHTYIGWFVDYYQDARYIEIEYDFEQTTLKKGQIYDINFKVLNTSSIDFYFDDKQMPLYLNVAFIGDDPVRTKPVRLVLPHLSVLKAGEQKEFKSTFKVPESLHVRPYTMTLSMFSKLGFTTNSRDMQVDVIE